MYVSILNFPKKHLKLEIRKPNSLKFYVVQDSKVEQLNSCGVCDLVCKAEIIRGDAWCILGSIWTCFSGSVTSALCVCSVEHFNVVVQMTVGSITGLWP